MLERDRWGILSFLPPRGDDSIGLEVTKMTTAEAVFLRLRQLPDSAQREVLDFVEFLESRKVDAEERQDAAVWNEFSLTAALRGMEDEEAVYVLEDLKESFR
jgi:hypothetical protein